MARIDREDVTDLNEPDGLERLPKVRRRAGDVSASTVWRWIKKGSFPAPVRLSDGVVAWRVSEVRAWIESRQVEPAQASQRRGGRRRSCGGEPTGAAVSGSE